MHSTLQPRLYQSPTSCLCWDPTLPICWDPTLPICWDPTLPICWDPNLPIRWEEAARTSYRRSSFRFCPSANASSLQAESYSIGTELVWFTATPRSWGISLCSATQPLLFCCPPWVRLAFLRSEQLKHFAFGRYLATKRATCSLIVQMILLPASWIAVKFKISISACHWRLCPAAVPASCARPPPPGYSS